MAEVPPMEVKASIRWDKKSKKTGKLLELLADAVEREAERRAEEMLDDAWDQGYATALRDAQRFGLTTVLECND